MEVPSTFSRGEALPTVGSLEPGQEEDNMSVSATEEEEEGPRERIERRLALENPPTIQKSSSTSPHHSLDRRKICPMYLRLFCRLQGHHPAHLFSPNESHRLPVDDEVVIYTWRDATLRELCDLIGEVNLECRRREVRFDLQLVYANLRGGVQMKPLGVVLNGRKGRDDGITLEQVRFVQGDFIDVAIFMPGVEGPSSNNNGRPAPTKERRHVERGEINSRSMPTDFRDRYVNNNNGRR